MLHNQGNTVPYLHAFKRGKKKKKSFQIKPEHLQGMPVDLYRLACPAEEESPGNIGCRWTLTCLSDLVERRIFTATVSAC